MLKVCLSHDIDRTKKTYQYLTKIISSLLKGNFKGVKNQLLSLLEKKPYWTFNEFIEIEQKYGIKSTVFFLNETIKFKISKPKTFKLAFGRYNILDKKIKEIIKLLDSQGWEIGVHGSYNSYNDKELLSKEKQVLENIVGHPIIGIRQHYLNLNDNTWLYQKELGFKYDSSWGFTNNIGFKEDKYLPFKPFNDDFTVFPLVIMDTCFMSTSNKWDQFEKLLDICEAKNSVLVINFHQHVFNKYDFPGYKETYCEIIERCKSRNAEFKLLSNLI